jgi:hypothetical protein
VFLIGESFYNFCWSYKAVIVILDVIGFLLISSLILTKGGLFFVILFVSLGLTVVFELFLMLFYLNISC